MSEQGRPITRGALTKFKDHFNARLLAVERAPVKAWLWLRLVRSEGRNRRAIARVQGRYDDLLLERDSLVAGVERLRLKVMFMEERLAELEAQPDWRSAKRRANKIRPLQLGEPPLSGGYLERLFRTLKRHGLTIEDTVPMTDDEILSWENVGPKTLKWIRWSASR